MTPFPHPDRRGDTPAGLVTVPVETEDDVVPRYRGTPVGTLLLFHNLGRPPAPPALPAVPRLVIVTCMDHRVSLDVPEGFAFQVRTAGATPVPVVSNVAFAIAVARVSAICVIGHTDCAMCGVEGRIASMVDHLVGREGWDPDEARAQARALRETCRIDDPAGAAQARAQLLAGRFPSCLVAPLLYRVEGGALEQVEVVEPG